MDRRTFIRLCSLSAAGFAGVHPLHRLAMAQDETGPPELDGSYVYHCPDLVEITEPAPLILPDGSCRCAWARRPVIDLNLEDASFSSSKKKMRQALKMWDMYHVYTPECTVHFIVAWTHYTAFLSGIFYDRNTRELIEDAAFLPPTPRIPMMRNSTAGRTEFVSENVRALFEAKGEHRKLTVEFPAFKDTDLSAEIDLFLPADHDSISGLQLAGPRRPYFGNKINCMTASGRAVIGGREYLMKPEDSFGALDYGRGYYPRKLFWYWATASGRHSDGKLLGFNLGYGNDPANETENAVFYDGKITKIGRVDCHAPSDDNLMSPWTVRDREGRVNIILQPEHVRKNEVSIGQNYSNGRPAFGRYSGKLVLESGKAIEFKDLFGLYEWVNSRW